MSDQNLTRTPIGATTRGRPRRRVFWSRILRPGAGGSWEHLAEDEEFRTFLVRRLSEERTAAEERLLAASTSTTPLRALQLLDDLIDDLGNSILPDETTLQVLTTVHAEHPDFRAHWLSSTVHATI